MCQVTSSHFKSFQVSPGLESLSRYLDLRRWSWGPQWCDGRVSSSSASRMPFLILVRHTLCHFLIGTIHIFSMVTSGTDLLEVPTIYKAYGREYPHKIWPYMVQYLHFRILKISHWFMGTWELRGVPYRNSPTQSFKWPEMTSWWPPMATGFDVISDADPG